MATFTTGEVLREDIVTTYSKSGGQTVFDDNLFTVGNGERVTLQILDMKLYYDGFSVDYSSQLFIKKSNTSTGGTYGAAPNVLNLIHLNSNNQNINEVTYYTETGAFFEFIRDPGFYGQYFLRSGDSLRLAVSSANVTVDLSVTFSLKKYSLFS